MMKKMVICFCLMMSLTSAAFTREYLWDCKTHWANNNPEVVKTMPGVQAFLKSLGVNAKDIEFVNIDEDDMKTVDAVVKYAEKNVVKYPEIGQFMYFNDVSNIFIIVFFDISEITGENVRIGLFTMKLVI